MTTDSPGDAHGPATTVPRYSSFSLERPTRTRFWVVVFAVTLAIVTYMHRVCISQAAPLITRDFGLSKVQMGYVFSAFSLSYALFEIPGGFLGDWIGPRKVLMRIVVWWSFFTAATGWAWNLVSLWIARFLFGAGQAGCFPNLTRAFTTWLPQEERVRAQGIMWMSARWGGAFTPLIVVWMFQYLSWPRAFELLGAVGLVWALLFYRWYRDNPRDHKSVNQAELELLKGADASAVGHSDVPWLKFLRSRSVWLLWIQYFCLAYGWYFYITWLPTYLQEARGLEFGESAILAILPLFLGGIGSLFCGFASSHVTKWTGSVQKTRRLMACLGFSGATGFLVLSTFLGNPVLAMLSIGMASFSNDLVMPGSWGACMDIGGKHAGTLSGAMNMMGNFGGVASPVAIGYILKNTDNNWDITFYTAAAIYFMGTFCWFFLDSVTPIDQQ